MDKFARRRFHDPDRFLHSFPPPDAGIGAAAGDVELDEEEVFWLVSDSPESNHPSISQNSIPNPTASPPSPSRNAVGGYRFKAVRNFGILAALSDEQKGSLLQRKTSISPSSSASNSPVSSSSAWLIPVMPAVNVHGRKIYQQSAPVNVPMVPNRMRRAAGYLEDVERRESGGNEATLLPPHGIVARAYGMESPMTAFSVVDGAGRTHKGRDTRQVCNAAWRQTGFLG